MSSQEKGSPRTGPCWHPDLDLLASRTVRNNCLLFKPPSPLYFCHGSPSRLTQWKRLYKLQSDWPTSPPGCPTLKSNLIRSRLNLIFFLLNQPLLLSFTYLLLYQCITCLPLTSINFLLNIVDSTSKVPFFPSTFPFLQFLYYFKFYLSLCLSVSNSPKSFHRMKEDCSLIWLYFFTWPENKFQTP